MGSAATCPPKRIDEGRHEGRDGAQRVAEEVQPRAAEVEGVPVAAGVCSGVVGAVLGIVRIVRVRVRPPDHVVEQPRAQAVHEERHRGDDEHDARARRRAPAERLDRLDDDEHGRRRARATR